MGQLHTLASISALRPPVALEPPRLAADVRIWWAEAPNNVLNGVELHVVAPTQVTHVGRARLFARADGQVLQLPLQVEPMAGLMHAAWLSQDGLTHHASVVMAAADGLQRWVARGEGAERRYIAAPLLDGWYAFALDQEARLLLTGSPEGGPRQCGSAHRQILGSLPGLFFGELCVARGRIEVFNNYAPLHATAAHLEAPLRQLCAPLCTARFVAYGAL